VIASEGSSKEEDNIDEVQENIQDDSKEEDERSGGDNSDSEKEDIDGSNDFEANKDQPLIDQFPMRNTFNFDNLVISSNFDAGNLRKCIDISDSNSDENLDSEEILKSNKNK
jgi:hypothetical protein